MEDKETFGITKKKLEHSAVPRLNEHPETNIKMVAGGGGGGGGGGFSVCPRTQIFFWQNNLPTSWSLEELLPKANTTLGYSYKNP